MQATGDLLLDLEVKNDPAEPDYDPDQGVARRVARWVENPPPGATRHRHLIRPLGRGRGEGNVCGTHRVAAGALGERWLWRSTGRARPAIRWLLPHWTSLTGNATKAIARAHDVGLTVVAWTVDDTELMRSLADAGIDGIVTNDLGGAASLLAG